MVCLEFLLSFLLIAQLAEPLIPAEITEPISAPGAAHNFLQALLAGELDDLIETGTDPFSFDGRVVKGRDEIKAYWKRFLARHGRELKEQESGEISVFDYKSAVEKFGKPPKKFSRLNLKRCKFAAVTLDKRNGFLMILSKSKKAGWQVTAVTD